MIKPNHDLPFGHLDYCQVCGSSNLELILDLGHQGPCDSLLNEYQLHEVEQTYPLHFVLCEKCGLAQLDYVVDPKVLFYSDYPYRSGITQTLVTYLQGIAKAIINKYDLKKKSLVVDIGSNDGTLLHGFKKYGMKVIGIETTNIANIANNNGIPTLNTFFSEDISNKICHEHGKASVVTATNMFAHVKNLGELIRGTSELLIEGGIMVVKLKIVAQTVGIIYRPVLNPLIGPFG